ncbi:phage transcriptional regulator, AlpA [Thiocapsa marina 5811]|uniref:Phage transcriptional regulator, AlpA n=2 Tax=Thiocapsa marina TaxID=244573 RepID=F9UA84_9GAMM|nr:phage transcriptional regulator, AlpA [Thiocapsa marina 5811]
MSGSFLRLPQVLALAGLQKSALYKRIGLGQFPRPVKLSARCAVWPEDEIRDWQKRQIDSRDNAA